MRHHIFLLSTIVATLIIPLPSLASANVNLPVPFVWQIPDGVWARPWSGACEEASIVMVENYYAGRLRPFTRIEMKNLMKPLFQIQDKLFGSNLDTNATRTLKLINDYTSFDSSIVRNPTLEQIKDELAAGRPVISLHNGRALNNPLHSYNPRGNGAHMVVITGFSDEKGVFFTNDPEIKSGLDYPYRYATIMDSLRDLNHETNKPTGPPTVLFTEPKQFVRANGDPKVYLLKSGKKHHITNSGVFNKHRWNWRLIKQMPKEELEALETGAAITK